MLLNVSVLLVSIYEMRLIFTFRNALDGDPKLLDINKPFASQALANLLYTSGIGVNLAREQGWGHLPDLGSTEVSTEVALGCFTVDACCPPVQMSYLNAEQP